MMLNQNSKIIILGGGIAGTTCAEDLRKANDKLDITIIERELHPLYSRVLLPHFVQDKIPLEKVFLKKESWYQENNINYMSGVYAENIDFTHQFVLTSEGRELPYDVLIIATGGEVNLLEQDARGLVYFRTLDDAQQIKSLIQEAKLNQGSATAFGGGFIALEFINAFKKHNLDTNLVIRGNGFWTKQLKPEVSMVLEDYLQKNDINFYKNTSVDIEDQLEISYLKLDSGEKISSSILGLGLGIRPDFTVFNNELKTNQGILTDQFLKTSLDNVYAIGDIAEFYDEITETNLMTGNWLSALMQARILAKNLVSEKPEPFRMVTSYATKLLDLDIVAIGNTNLKDAEDVIIYNTENGTYQIFNKDNRTIGAILIGSVKERSSITQQIQNKQKYEL